MWNLVKILFHRFKDEMSQIRGDGIYLDETFDDSSLDRYCSLVITIDLLFLFTFSRRAE